MATNNLQHNAQYKPGQRRQQGFVVAYIIYGIALMALVGSAYGRLQVSKDQARLVQEAVESITAQIDVIRSKVLLCGAIYPDGDHGEFNARFSYPAPPAASAHRANLDAVVCPGGAGGPVGLAALGDGVPLPITPPDFNPWEYEHTEADGIRVRLSPQVSGGGSNVRVRLARQLDGLITVNPAEPDVLVVQILE